MLLTASRHMEICPLSRTIANTTRSTSIVSSFHMLFAHFRVGDLSCSLKPGASIISFLSDSKP